MICGEADDLANCVNSGVGPTRDNRLHIGDVQRKLCLQRPLHCAHVRLNCVPSEVAPVVGEVDPIGRHLDDAPTENLGKQVPADKPQNGGENGLARFQVRLIHKAACNDCEQPR